MNLKVIFYKKNRDNRKLYILLLFHHRINVFQTEQQMDCALDLMRRLPPQQIEKNLSDLIDLVPSLCEDLLSSVDQPLKIAKDKESGKDYLLCDYNRDGDSYRFVPNKHLNNLTMRKKKEKENHLP